MSIGAVPIAVLFGSMLLFTLVAGITAIRQKSTFSSSGPDLRGADPNGIPPPSRRHGALLLVFLAVVVVLSSAATISIAGDRGDYAITALTGHTDEVTSVAFSPDGKTLATASSDHTVRLWDVASGRTTATLTGHTSGVWSVAFSPDGKILATGGGDNDLRDGGDDRTVRLWDVATRRTTATLTGHTRIVLSVAFSPDGKTLATASYDGTVRLWNVASGKTTVTLKGPAFYSVAFSPDGKTLATGTSPWNNSGAGLWDVASGRTTATLAGDTGHVYSVAFNPDGTTLATASHNTLRLWDVASGGKTTASLTGPIFHSAAFSPDGKTLATGIYDGDGDGSVRLWDVTTRKPTATLTGHTNIVRSLAFSPDGKTLTTASADHTVGLWNVTR